jgi:hypothetical protein
VVADPALLLGAAVVRTALRIWARDPEADRFTTWTDVVGVRDQRRIRRLFEDLEERVADSILLGFGGEFRRLPENERDTAVRAVLDTLDRIELTRDGRPDALGAEHRAQSSGPLLTDSLGAEATDLYDVLLQHCGVYAAEIANQLPAFDTNVLSDLLSRRQEIVRQIDERLDRLPMVLVGTDVKSFETSYLRLVAKQLDRVELFGVDTSERVSSYPLSVAYVKLSISADKPTRRTTSTDDVLTAARRVFIRGEAGSGKTTLLQWLAVRAAWREDGTGSVPLFIRLRRYVDGELPAPEDMLADVAAVLAPAMPPGWVRGLLLDGRALVLVDGVDELPDHQRVRAREWLRQLLTVFPNARYVVTARPTAAKILPDDSAFDTFDIEPMTMADIEVFVAHWHAAMADGVTDNGELERLKISRNVLTHAIRTYPHLRAFAVNPLMCALLCALHLDRRMQLPRDPMELYSAALETLLERRDAERGIGRVGISLTRGEKMLLLQDLAYWLMRNGWSFVSRQQATERLDSKLRELHRVQNPADEVLSFLLERSGLLRMPVDGQIEFVHQTFQWFLAAREAVEAGDIGVLVQHAHREEWREVVLMAVGHAHLRQTDELLRRLLERAEGESTKLRYRLQALAVGAAQYAPALLADLNDRLTEIAGQLVPPRSLSQADALARAGELALEMLSSHDGYSEVEAAPTIRMAAAIGGDQAIAVIAACARRNTKAVRGELERAWSKFDPEEFATRVLADTPLAEDVRIDEPTLLAGVKHLPLRSLECDFARGHGDVDYLADLPLLEHFTVRDPALRDLSAVAEHPALATLRIGQRTAAVDVAPMGRCRTLTRVSLPLESIEDPRRLSHVTQIRELEITTAATSDDVLPFLAPGLRLTRLAFWRLHAERDLDRLVAAPQLADLEYLRLSGAEDLASIAGIDRWSRTMTGIALHAGELDDVSALAGLPSLTQVNLTDTPVASLEFARELSALKRLDVGGDTGTVLDLSPLRDLPALRFLHIGGSAPVDLSGLAGANGLHVYIGGTRRRRVLGEGKLNSSVVVRHNPTRR